MYWTIAAKRIDTSKSTDYPTQETLEKISGEGFTSHDATVKALVDKYKNDDSVKVVGSGHVTYKDTNLGKHYI